MTELRIIRSVVFLLVLLLALSCSEDGESDDSPGKQDEVNPPMPEGELVMIAVDANERDGLLDEVYLGAAIDTAQFVGPRLGDDATEYYSRASAPELENAVLRNLSSALAPSILRIGGTDADGAYFCPEEGDCEVPESYRDVYVNAEKFKPSYYTHEDIRRIADFAEAVDARISFCLNFGPGPRDPLSGAWTADNARELIRYAKSLPNGDRFYYWEGGNEVNGYGFNFHMPEDFGIEQYAADLATLRGLIDEENPDAYLSAPATYFFPDPMIGDIGKFTSELMELAGASIDVLNWHLYATQSENCGEGPLERPNPTSLETLFDEDLIAISRSYAAYVKEAAGNRPVHMGETASAQCGGQQGISDTMLDALWFADWLGIMIEEGTRAIVRQTLLGWDYGVIDQDTLEPRPTFLVMVMHRRMVDFARLKTYVDRSMIKAHGYCNARKNNAATLVLSNPSAETIVAEITFNDTAVIRASQWTLASDEGMTGTRASIEGKTADAKGNIPDPPGTRVRVENGSAYSAVLPEAVVFVSLEFVETPGACSRYSR